MKQSDWRAWWVETGTRKQFVVSNTRDMNRAEAIDYGRGLGLAHGAINLNARRVFIPAKALRAMRRRAK